MRKLSILSMLVLMAMVLCMFAGAADTAQSGETETCCAVFQTDAHIESVDIYYTRNAASPDEEHAEIAAARNPVSGEPDAGGTGSIIFRPRAEQGYTACVSVEGPCGGLEEGSGQLPEGAYEIWNAAGALTVTITAAETAAEDGTGDGEADEPAGAEGTADSEDAADEEAGEAADMEETADTEDAADAADEENPGETGSAEGTADAEEADSTEEAGDAEETADTEDAADEEETGEAGSAEETAGAGEADSEETGTEGSEGETAEETVLPFDDVVPGAYFEEAVRWACSSQIALGESRGHFNPGGSASRAQTVTFLWRLAGCPKADKGFILPFADVSADAYYAEAVRWAAWKKITLGVDAAHFDPDGTVTRGQFAAFLYRYAGSRRVDAPLAFGDVTPDLYCYDACCWAWQRGIAMGMGESRFYPDDYIRRADVVTMIYRYRMQAEEAGQTLNREKAAAAAEESAGEADDILTAIRKLLDMEADSSE